MEREVIEVTSPLYREYNWAMGVIRALEKYKTSIEDHSSSLERLQLLNEAQLYLNEATRQCIYQVKAEEK